MKLILVLLFCISTARAVFLEYDGDETETPNVEAGDPHGHRPVIHGDYRSGSTQPHTSTRFESGTSRSRFRPTPPSRQTIIIDDEKERDLGGCKHLSEDLGVLCPNGCELRTLVVKEENNMKPIIADLQLKVSNLSRSTNAIHIYVERVDREMQQKQSQYTGNNQIVSSYNVELEERFALIKNKVETTLPSTIRMMRSLVDNLKEKLQKLERAVITQKEFCKRPCTVSCNIPVVSGKECNDIYEKGGATSQLYLIQPDSSKTPYKVYCDMTTAEGGWTLIQNRQDGSVDFGRSWDTYKKGFGNIAFDVGKGFCDTPGEYWLGNDRISQMTKLKHTELFFEMQDWKDDKITAHYAKFVVQNEVNKYRLSVNGYSGTAGNTLMEGTKMLFGDNRTMTIHQNMMFSTYDRDNDGWAPGDTTKQCAREDGGGWWYNRCHSSNPNGRYYWGGEYTREMAKHGTDDGIVWMDWKGSWYSMKKISMKIRPEFTQTFPGGQIPQATFEGK
ncbi:fibrinogen beta chain [Heptranchias perlo]|uniref:fibrinogen beta chain n=1 Tax=Heptranchias perlo TaxID=212740 RepID=UPI0035599BB9